MERAAKVFRRLLHRIRRRKHELFLQQLYMPEYHQHQGYVGFEFHFRFIFSGID